MRRKGRILLCAVLSFLAGCGYGSYDFDRIMRDSMSSGSGDYVVLVHGLGRTRRSMKAPQKFLEQQGYTVLNFGYPSTKYPIETLSREYLERYIQLACPDQSRRIHFVTHSMGGILVRHYLREHPLPNVGRVVMLAPPNQGSEVVDRENRWCIFRWLLGPAGQQLGTAPSSLPNQLGPVHFELGVIAGDRSIEPFHSLMIPGPDDGKVSIRRTRIEGMQDFLLVHNTHTFLMRSKEVLRQTAHFLQTGTFSREHAQAVLEEIHG